MTTTTGTPQTIETYAAALSAALRGPRRLRLDLVTEARDGLVDATEAYESDGLVRAEAERRAVADFGPLDEIAAAYRPELALAQARRTAVGLSLVILIQPLVWADGRWPWSDGPTTGGSWLHRILDASIEWTGMTMFVLTLLGIGACGAGVRWPAVRRTAALATSVGTLVSALLLGLVATGLGVTGQPGTALIGMTWTTLFVMGPSMLVAVSAARALTLTTR